MKLIINLPDHLSCKNIKIRATLVGLTIAGILVYWLIKKNKNNKKDLNKPHSLSPKHSNRHPSFASNTYTS
jgi:hypothetical protein